jgi:Icc-related predicted phosphoesterase
MRILVIADEESKYLWDFYESGRLDDIDLILSAGDLNPHYLSFLVTFAKAPVLYVRGNHDDKYSMTPPEGCICIEDQIYEYEGVRILGLGGSMRYKPGENQYTERQMRRRVRKMWPQFLWYGGFDILLTHAPAYQLNDGRDLPHQGFRVFCRLMEKYKPKFFVHGHVHMSYGRQHKRYDKYCDTHVINAFERCVFEFEAEDVEGSLSR